MFEIVTGDASHYLTTKLLPNIQYERFNRALCLLDPYGLHLDWEVVRQSGQSRAIDMFLNFPCHGYEQKCNLAQPRQSPG